MDQLTTIFGLLLIFGAVGLGLGLFALRIYGIYLSFKKAWYIGAASLFVPFFADVVGIAKFFFKKDLLS
jgi:hypothetical protein